MDEREGLLYQGYAARFKREVSRCRTRSQKKGIAYKFTAAELGVGELAAEPAGSNGRPRPPLIGMTIRPTQASSRDMQITREYQASNVNWHLLPQLFERAVGSIPSDELKDGSNTLSPLPQVTVTTYSQTATFDSLDDFLAFLRVSSEGLEKVEATLDCLMVPGTISPYIVSPPFFRLSWRARGTVISVWRARSTEALPLLQTIEETLGLTPAHPREESEVAAEGEGRLRLKRTVFIAHSFDDVGRSYAFQLTKFLSLLGFEVATGEGFSPESVSAKVRRRLLAQEIVIAVMSHKDDLTWLIQESASVSLVAKPIFLLIERGVEFKPGILGDQEYILFEPGQITGAFTPILEGLRELGFALS